VAVPPFARRDVHRAAAEVVVRIGGRRGCDALEQRFEVPKEQWLVLVDQQAGGGVPGLRHDETFDQADLVDRA
jgi:hypothetical protein